MTEATRTTLTKTLLSSDVLRHELVFFISAGTAGLDMSDRICNLASENIQTNIKYTKFLLLNG